MTAFGKRLPQLSLVTWLMRMVLGPVISLESVDFVVFGVGRKQRQVGDCLCPGSPPVAGDEHPVVRAATMLKKNAATGRGLNAVKLLHPPCSIFPGPNRTDLNQEKLFHPLAWLGHQSRLRGDRCEVFSRPHERNICIGLRVKHINEAGTLGLAGAVTRASPSVSGDIRPRSRTGIQNRPAQPRGAFMMAARWRAIGPAWPQFLQVQVDILITFILVRKTFQLRMGPA